MVGKESTYKFSIQYEGGRFSNHLIEAKKLANSLNGLNKILNRLIKGDKNLRGQLFVTASPKEGSIEVDMMLVLIVLSQFPIFESAKSVMEAVSILIDLIKQYRGRHVPPKEQKIIFNNCKFEIGPIVNSVYEDPSSQKFFVETFSPIKGCDFGRVRIKGKDGVVLTEVTREDLVRIDEYRCDMHRKLKQEAGTKRGKTGKGRK